MIVINHKMQNKNEPPTYLQDNAFLCLAKHIVLDIYHVGVVGR